MQYNIIIIKPHYPTELNIIFGADYMKNMERSRLIQFYKQEVEELTALVRKEWLDLKEQLEEKGLTPDSSLVIGYIEGENESEIGLLYTQDEKLIRFILTDNDLNFQQVEKDQVISEFPQVNFIKDITKI